MSDVMVKSQSRWTGDLVGGASAALFTVPSAMAIGALVVAPLGAQHLATGVVLGLVGAVAGGLVAALVGGGRIGISAPGGQLALLVATAVAALAGSGTVSDQAVIAVVAVTGCVAGLTQIGIGQLRLGRLVAYLPYPVVAGCGAGAAAVIVISQLPAFVGGAVGGDLAALVAVDDWRWGALSVAVCAMALAVATRRWLPRLPDVLVALAGGWALHLGLGAWGPQLPGPEIGSIPAALPDGAGLRAVFGEGLATVRAELDAILPQAIAAGVLGGIVSLVAGAIIEGQTAVRRSGNRELLAQGCANVASAVAGGIPVSLSESRTVIAWRAGARSRRAGVIHALAILAAAAALSPAIARMPVAVLAALLVVGTLRTVDAWAIDLFRLALRRGGGRNRDLVVNLAIVIGVAGLTVLTSLFWGLVVGLGVAVVQFIVTMSGSSVRRVYRAGDVRSKRVRSDEAMALLGREGRRIAVFELQGALFFGTADHLAREVEAVTADADWVILDLRRVTSVDSSGARVIQRLHERLAERRAVLALAHAGPGQVGWNVFEGLGVIERLGRERCFADIDAALEWCEEDLLRSSRTGRGESALRLAGLAITRDLAAEEVAILGKHLELRTVPAGATVFAEGDPGDELYILLDGEVSIRTRLEDGRSMRLSTFSPGVVFGEMALLDGSPRSASVVADVDSECLVLSVASYAELGRDHPPVALAFTRNLGRLLAERLRRANAHIRALEH